MKKRPMICFDWDGTLADSMQLCIGECRLALQRSGLPDLPDEILMKCNGPTNLEGCAILGVPPELTESYLNLRAAANLELTPTVNKLFQGIPEMLKTLNEVADLAIVSNGQRPYIDLCLRIFGLEAFFPVVYGYTKGMTKSMLLQDLLDHEQPGRAIMVGDRLGDIKAGRDCGLETIAAAYGYGNEEEYNAADVRCNTV